MMFEDFSVGCRIGLATTAVGAPLTAALILSRSPIAGAKLGLAALGYFGLVGGLALLAALALGAGLAIGQSVFFAYFVYALTKIAVWPTTLGFTHQFVLRDNFHWSFI